MRFFYFMLQVPSLPGQEARGSTCAGGLSCSCTPENGCCWMHQFESQSLLVLPCFSIFACTSLALSCLLWPVRWRALGGTPTRHSSRHWWRQDSRCRARK
ncbi:unnamed protein product [Discosporangium mesarthrocarpum]